MGYVRRATCRPSRNPLEGPLEAVERLEVELAVEEPGDPRQVVVEDEPAGRVEPLAPERVAVVGQPLGAQLLEPISADEERHRVHEEVADTDFQVVDSLFVDQARDKRPVGHVEVQVRKAACAIEPRDRVAVRLEAAKLLVQSGNGVRGRDHLHVEAAVHRRLPARARAHEQNGVGLVPRGEERGDLLRRLRVCGGRICVGDHRRRSQSRCGWRESGPARTSNAQILQCPRSDESASRTCEEAFEACSQPLAIWFPLSPTRDVDRVSVKGLEQFQHRPIVVVEQSLRHTNFVIG
jgi:hypothetical protein